MLIFFLLRLPRGIDRGRQRCRSRCSSPSSVSICQQHSGEPAVDRRDRLRHSRRRRRRDGREHLSAACARRRGTDYRIRDVILEAASEVNRPIVYAIAVIVAGFLPIYALTGPPAKLFRPMADTTIYALLGSLRAHADADPRAVRLGIPSRRARAHAIAPSSGSATITRAGSTGVSRIVRATVVASLVAVRRRRSASRSRAAASSCRSSTKARSGFARRCRTRSRSRNRREIVPQVRAILQSFPEVTVVASEHGRDDAGTDPTGFFNAEFYVGLKPYSEWNGAFHSKDAADRGGPEEARRLSRHHVQLHSAGRRRGRRSAHRAQGVARRKDLRHRPRAPRGERARDQGDRSRSVPGIEHVTLVQELGQPSLTITVDRAKIARYGLSADAINGLIEAAVGGAAATQVVQGERTFDLVVRLQPQYRAHAGADRQHPARDARRPAGSAARGRRRPDRQRRGVHLSPGQLALHRRAVLGRGARPRQRRRRRDARPSTSSVKLPIGYSVRAGAASSRSTRRRARR